MDSLVREPPGIYIDTSSEIQRENNGHQTPVYFDTHSSNTQFRVSATTPISYNGCSRNDDFTPNGSEVKANLPYKKSIKHHQMNNNKNDPSFDSPPGFSESNEKDQIQKVKIGF